MADVFTLTPQPIRLTATGRQPIYLAVDVSQYDSLDVEAVCAVEGTAASAALNLFTGMQTDTDDGWVVPASNFGALSGTGQQITQVSLGSGLLQYLRWDVSSLGGATSLTFFIRGVARTRVGGVGLATPGGGLRSANGLSLDPMQLGYSQVDNAAITGATDGAANDTVGCCLAFNKPCTITGIRLYWGGYSSTTLKCQIWDPSFASLVTVNIAVTTSAGIYTANLVTPISITASNCYKKYQFSMYDTGASHYTYVGSAHGRPGDPGATLGGGGGAYSDSSYENRGGYITVIADTQYSAGDARPTTTLSQTTQYIPIEPIITAP